VAALKPKDEVDEMVDPRKRQETNPRWAGLQAYDPGDESADDPPVPVASKRPTHIPTVPIDPNIALIHRGLDLVDRLEARFGEPVAQAAKQPGARGWLVAAGIVGALSGLIFGTGAAALFVWVHDQSTRGSVSTSINGLIDATNAIVDQSEEDMGCIENALVAGFAGKPIQPCSTRGHDKIRRHMPDKLPQ
jgi:hypothetical protein